MNNIYPLKFKTIFKDKIWGGKKINDFLGKDFSPLPNCGETWEISGVKGDESVVSEGPLKGSSLPRLVSQFKDVLVGKKVYEKFQNTFPLLIKFIDANDDLSIQVHPDDALAMERHNSFGKTEMWYILQAEPGATLISGFSKEVDERTYLSYLKSNKLDEILNKEDARAGDVFFLPAGRVHSIGKGLLLAEIQQTSDVTYRIYDFDRVDAEGKRRDLHTKEALAAIDYKVYDNYKTVYSTVRNEVNTVVESKYFATNKLILDRPTKRDINSLDSFVIYICLEGAGRIEYKSEAVEIKKGEVVLVPASIKEFMLLPVDTIQLLETYVP